MLVAASAAAAAKLIAANRNWLSNMSSLPGLYSSLVR
jgi:hypothetical protein